MIFVGNPCVREVWVNYEIAIYSVCGEINYIIHVYWLYLTSLDCSRDVILLFVLIRYAKMSHFVYLGYIAFVGIQVEKPRGNPHEKYRGVPKGGVIKGCDKGGVIKGCDKGHVHVFISGMQKSCIL